MNDIIVAYISPDIESETREKIAEMLRIRQIRTTTNKDQATVVILTPNQVPGPSLTLSEIAEKLIQQTAQEIIELKDFMYQDISHKPQKPKHAQYIRVLSKYNNTKQRQQTRFLIRTRHK